MSRAVAREQRYREPMIHAKIYVQETVSGSFGSTPPPPPPLPVVDTTTPHVEGRIVAAALGQNSLASNSPTTTNSPPSGVSPP